MINLNTNRISYFLNQSCGVVVNFKWQSGHSAVIVLTKMSKANPNVASQTVVSNTFGMPALTILQLTFLAVLVRIYKASSFSVLIFYLPVLKRTWVLCSFFVLLCIWLCKEIWTGILIVIERSSDFQELLTFYWSLQDLSGMLLGTVFLTLLCICNTQIVTVSQRNHGICTF